MRLWLAVVCVFVLVGCGGKEVSDETGMLTDDEIPGVQALTDRADLELSASAGVLVGDVVDVEVAVRSLDETSVNGPGVLFEFGDGVSVETVPEGCEVVAGGLDCLIGSDTFSGSLPTAPVVFVLPVKVAEGAVDSSVTMSATSRNNPVSNDPDPSNNVVTLELG